MDVAITGITVAFMLRVVMLKSQNTVLDLVLPFVIFFFIAVIYYVNKVSTLVKHFFHPFVIPAVGFLSARKTISQHDERYFMNESFASWTIMVLVASFSSPRQWHKVVFVNSISLLVYCILVFRHYGRVGNDFYVHVPTTFLLAGLLIRMNELNMRNSFNLLHESKQNEKKWLRVLTMLTDGVLVMQHTEADEGILLINDSLK